MDIQRSNRRVHASARIQRRKQLLDTRRPLPDEKRDRWSSPGQEGTQDVGVVNRQHLAEERQKRSARVLMPAIAHSLANAIVLTVLQRVHQLMSLRAR
jgi:hypothetical protein